MSIDVERFVLLDGGRGANPMKLISRERWSEGIAIRTIESYGAEQCYWCFEHCHVPVSDDPFDRSDVCKLDGLLIACCVPCWWQWWSGTWGCIGKAYLNRVLDEVRADVASGVTV